MATAADDGYRDFPLPAFGSMPDASDEQVVDLCKRWFETEVELVRRMMRSIVRGADPQKEAASITAVFYLQSVRNDRGIAPIVRLHLEGREKIREPKAVFITTVKLHRRSTLRGLIEQGAKAEVEGPLTGEGPADPEPLVEREPAERCAEIRAELVALGKAQAVPPDARARVSARVEELAALCHEALQDGALASLTDRQRFVFLLRVDPLNTDHGTALEYQQIEPLAGILGIPMTVDTLRQTLRTALLRLRRFPHLKDELGDG